MKIVETNIQFKGELRKRALTKRAIIHHSASGDVSAGTIHSWHQGQGWAGIGYHFVIRQNGVIERGRPEWALGVHAGPGNTDSIGICLAGNFEAGKPTPAQMDALVWLLKDYLMPKYGKLSVIGHRDVMQTACPGRNFPWAELRERLEDDEKVIYKTYNDLPAWAKPTIKKLLDRKSIAGDGKNINLSGDVVKVLVILDREGMIK